MFQHEVVFIVYQVLFELIQQCLHLIILLMIIIMQHTIVIETVLIVLDLLEYDDTEVIIYEHDYLGWTKTLMHQVQLIG